MNVTHFDPQIFLVPVSVGIVATAMLDLWALLLNRMLGLPATNWGHVGRWVAGIPWGFYRAAPIAACPAVSFERSIGWTFHYLIGIAYAWIYLGILDVASMVASLGSAALFGLATVLAPWLILQPGLGIGFFASRAPKPNLTRALNVLAHLVFGVGLFVGWQVISLAG